MAVLGAALIGMTTWALLASTPTDQRFHGDGQAPKQRTDPRPVFLVIGDSGTAGTRMNTPGREWASLVADQLGWKLERDAISGTGYVVQGASVRFADRISRDVGRFDPDLVVVAGGSNDLMAGVSRKLIVREARATLDRVEAAFPGVPIVLFSAWSPGEPDSAHLALAGSMQLLAQERGLRFLDVSWFTVGGPGIIGSDGIHPTDKGHRLMAFRVIDAGILQAAMPRR